MTVVRETGGKRRTVVENIGFVDASLRDGTLECFDFVPVGENFFFVASVI
jgi:hypothetical protein